DAYSHDLAKLRDFALGLTPAIDPAGVRLEHLQDFLTHEGKKGVLPSSQARLVSAVRSFFKQMRRERTIADDPSELLKSPRQGRHLPTFLSVEDIDRLVEAMDMSRPLAHRDRAMLETLYGCGLRVSELCGLLISRLHFDDGYIRVVGKGDKERLVPIGPSTIAHVQRYLHEERVHLPVQARAEDILFLNARGAALSRVWVFKLVKRLAVQAGLPSTI